MNCSTKIGLVLGLLLIACGGATPPPAAPADSVTTQAPSGATANHAASPTPAVPGRRPRALAVRTVMFATVTRRSLNSHSIDTISLAGLPSPI